MKKRMTIILVAAVVLLASCHSYTTRGALKHITPPAESPGRIETRYSAILAQTKEVELTAEERIELLVEEIADLETVIAVYESDTTIAQLEAQIAELQKQVRTRSDELTALQSQLAELQAEHATRVDEISTLSALVETYESDQTISLLQTEIGAQASVISSLTAKLNATNSALTELQEQSEADRVAREERIASLLTELEGRATDADVSRWYDQITELEVALATAETEAAQAASEVVTLTTLVDALQKKQHALTATQSELTEELAEVHATLTALQKAGEIERIDREERIAALLTELEGRATDEDVSRWYEQITQLEEALAIAKANAKQAETEIGTLTALVEGLQKEKKILQDDLATVRATLAKEQEILGKYQAERQAEEQVRKALEKAEQDRLERERFLASQIPDVDALRVPHRYIATEEPKVLSKGAILNTLFLPLGEEVWSSRSTATQVVHSISDLSYSVLFVTGAMENVIAVVRTLGNNAVLLEGGAIISDFAVAAAGPSSVRVALNEEQHLHLSLTNLYEAEVFTAFFDGESDWQAVQQSVSPAREAALEKVIQSGSLIDPTIMAASLYEPSHQDWSVFSPIAYRQTDYLWPLVAAVEEAGFYDTYRVTHFSAETDSGNTFYSDRFAERFDFVFARKALPLETAILPIGTLSAASESRWAITASFLIP